MNTYRMKIWVELKIGFAEYKYTYIKIEAVANNSHNAVLKAINRINQMGILALQSILDVEHIEEYEIKSVHEIKKIN